MNRHVVPAGRLEKVVNTVTNTTLTWLTRVGIGPAGTEELAVRGRTSGEWRRVPVFPLTVDGVRYLVAPRGTTQWVRNIRVAGGGELRLGRSRRPFVVTEVADGDKPRILRAYLAGWPSIVAGYFPGLTVDSPDDRWLEVAPGYPVFRLA